MARKPARLFWTLFLPPVLAAALGSLLVGAFVVPSETAGRSWLTGTLLVVALVAAAGAYGPLRLVRTLMHIRQGAKRMAREEFEARLDPCYWTRETRALARSVNALSAQLQERIRSLRAQRQQQDAVLASMAEGVLAVDTDDRLLALNGAAASLLGVDAERAVGRSIFETIRHAGIQRFIVRALHERRPIADVLVVHDKPVRHIDASGMPLRDGDGRLLGMAIVLHEITRLHRLEAAQRDFVANVSHELRTPLTSIKGFAETLLEGGLDDAEQARAFVTIMMQQAERLHDLVEDLLDLSRVEQSSASGTATLSEAPLAPLLQRCVAAAGDRADSAHDLQLVCDDEARAWINAGLLELAVRNLLDNAIKYSPAGGAVVVCVTRRAEAVAIEVIDQGVGISQGNLARIFERFYRVDKARSRAGGGSGLGLAIVQAIARAHAGHVEVDSELGRGSTFRIVLPVRVRRDSNRSKSTTSQDGLAVAAAQSAGGDAAALGYTARPS